MLQYPLGIHIFQQYLSIRAVAYHGRFYPGPLKIVIMNIMPTKIFTETQLLRVLGNTSLQIDVSFMHPISHTSKNTPIEHLRSFYQFFDEIKQQRFDGMIVSGAPVELLPFEEVDYWKELTEIMDWAKKNVF